MPLKHIGVFCISKSVGISNERYFSACNRENGPLRFMLAKTVARHANTFLSFYPSGGVSVCVCTSPTPTPYYRRSRGTLFTIVFLKRPQVQSQRQTHIPLCYTKVFAPDAEFFNLFGQSGRASGPPVFDPTAFRENSRKTNVF